MEAKRKELKAEIEAMVKMHACPESMNIESFEQSKNKIIALFHGMFDTAMENAGYDLRSELNEKNVAEFSEVVGKIITIAGDIPIAEQALSQSSEREKETHEARIAMLKAISDVELPEPRNLSTIIDFAIAVTEQQLGQFALLMKNVGLDKALVEARPVWN